VEIISVEVEKEPCAKRRAQITFDDIIFV